jgi:SAM-dependent methyltransferase
MSYVLDRSLRVTFDKIAKEYDAVRPAYPAICIDSIIEYSHISGSSKILEVGCGTGQATQLLVDRGFSVHCIDIGTELVEVARDKFSDNPKVKFDVMSFEDSRFPPKTFDLIYSATAFHWVDPEVRYKKAAQLLKPSGTLAIFQNLDTRQPSDLRSAIDAVYARFIPNEPDDRQRQSDFEAAVQEEINEVKSSEFFHSVEIKKVPWQVEFSQEKYMRLLNTFSYHRDIAPHVKAALIKGVGEVIQSYGGSITIHYDNVLILGKAK